MTKITNPYKPGTGQVPPYLAGREIEQQQFARLLEQEVILENLLITGLRGIGKTVLLETLRPIALSKDWFWTGDDFSESMSFDEDKLITRLLVDTSLLTSSVLIGTKKKAGFNQDQEDTHLDYVALRNLYDQTPGLPLDKLKHIFELVWTLVPTDKRGIIFAYDEAQLLHDEPSTGQTPLSLLLDLFSSLQRKGIRIMLILTGLPTLQPNLVATRTYSERMFHVVVLRQLNSSDSRDAVLKPLHHKSGTPKDGMVVFDEQSTSTIVTASGGYPYFIQFICREAYDVFEQRLNSGKTATVPLQSIMEKLDSNFFYGRWANTSEREKEMLAVIAQTNLTEFSPTDVANASKSSGYNKFSLTQTATYLKQLIDKGLIYKDRRGTYAFAVPLLGGYIRRALHMDIETKKTL